MLNLLRRLGEVWCLTAVFTTGAAAQNPTFSLEVVAVNGIEPLGGPTGKIAVAPDDELTIKLFIRDWSPTGEALRAYQATLETNSYTSGFAGSVKPIHYDEMQAQPPESKQENKEAVFVDEEDPDFIYGPLKTIAIVDSISPAYRWSGVLMDGTEAIVSNQDGTKFYGGTLRMRVSNDANGPFKIALDQTGNNSGLRTPRNTPIVPIDHEPLEIVVTEEARVLRILSCDPPDGAIDARQPAGNRRESEWNRLVLTLSGDGKEARPENFVVEDGTAGPPRVVSVTADGPATTLVLDRGLSPCVWTTIKHKPSRTHVRFGFLPGDVNNDGLANGIDLLNLVHSAAGEELPPAFRMDIDHDGACGVRDALRFIDLLTRPDACRRSLSVEPDIGS